MWLEQNQAPVNGNRDGHEAQEYCCGVQTSVFRGNGQGRQFQVEQFAAGHLHHQGLAREVGHINAADHCECKRNQDDRLCFQVTTWNVMTGDFFGGEP